MIENLSPREKQWKELFELINNTLARYGDIFTQGKEDFVLIDDYWWCECGYHDKTEVINAISSSNDAPQPCDCEHIHIIEVINPRAWSDDVQQEIRKILETSHKNWGVLINFQDGSDREVVIVYADGVETTP